jgi:hypothetical protein
VNERVEYPDVMLLMAGGRVAVHLVLQAPAPGWLEAVLRGYESESSLAGVLFLVADPRVAAVVRSAAARLGLSGLVHVQLARPGPVGAPA